MRFLVIGGITDSNTKENETDKLQHYCVSIGLALREYNHSLIICSPFNDSADFWVFSGYTQGDPTKNSSIEIHYVDNSQVKAEVLYMQDKAKNYPIYKIPSPPSQGDKNKSLTYDWLLCQLQALESCQAIIAIGGKPNGSANMLLLLAEAKKKMILPIPFLDGAANQSYYRKQYELKDKLGRAFSLLQDEHRFTEVFNFCVKELDEPIYTERDLNCFISYPRARPSEADYIETILRRRNIHIFRDESDFGTGHAIPSEITEAIHAANVFITVWCSEYACSPWCYDELELALDRQASGKMQLWILCVDSTRIIHPRARNLVSYRVNTREEVEGIILKLLDNSRN